MHNKLYAQTNKTIRLPVRKIFIVPRMCSLSLLRVSWCVFYSISLLFDYVWMRLTFHGPLRECLRARRFRAFLLLHLHLCAFLLYLARSAVYVLHIFETQYSEKKHPKLPQFFGPAVLHDRDSVSCSILVGGIFSRLTHDLQRVRWCNYPYASVNAD